METISRTTILIGILLTTVSAFAQTSLLAVSENSTAVENLAKKATEKQDKIVIVTGTRFAYPLVQKWIDDYSTINPSAQIIIESRGSTDPSTYDILIEVYDQGEEIKKNREYLHIARYAILPIANSSSAFAKHFSDKGLNQDLINQLFFHDIYADKEKETTINEPYTIYTRLQKAGVPIVFTKYFGYEQKDIKGKAIAGSDEHLLKAIVRDSTGVTYLPLTLIYDHVTKKPHNGLTVLPVDLNGNRRINDDEKFYGDLSTVIERIEGTNLKDIKNIPIEYVHLSVDKRNVNPRAIEFLRWVINNSQDDLHDFGYLTPEPGRFEKEKFEQFASKRNK
jgi:ABC-type phosphate transport system substrate-binding protein